MLQVASRWHCEAMQPDESSIRAVHRECQIHHPRPEKAQHQRRSPSVLALRSEHGRDFFPRVATQPEKGRTTSSSARTKPG